MTTEREVWLADHPSAPATTCTCGQELDLCHREHCPRCGVRVVGRGGRGWAKYHGTVVTGPPAHAVTRHVVWLGSVKSVTQTSPPTISTVGELARLRATSHRTAARGDPRQPARRAARGPRPVARAARLRAHRDPAARAGPARRPRRRAARRARPGQDPAAAHPGRPARRVDAGDRRAPSWASTRSSRSPHASQRRAAELGDDLPVAWRHRDERYAEKLATPDTSVADLIGDVDPMKVAEGRSLGDPETIHFGLIPRAHRGIVAINELPDLAERIQVAMLNVMEERDIQIRGYVLRLPLDVLRRGQRQPRGLHQPRPDHHPAQGPLRRRDPHPLPASSSTTRSP